MALEEIKSYFPIVMSRQKLEKIILMPLIF
uniref:Uncharacterized protein n=1 Tax=Rhizophora mucronata TaxID=61149 RepID=A0A2P2P9U1_RHIMU